MLCSACSHKYAKKPNLTLGVNWYVSHPLRLMANLIHGYVEQSAMRRTTTSRNTFSIRAPTVICAPPWQERAHRDYMNLPATAIKNRALLETIMEQHGFESLPTEWWHFDFQGWERFPISDRPID
jgi:hypothetical protein